jgi:Domain of unknown function (DUF4384)
MRILNLFALAALPLLTPPAAAQVATPRNLTIEQAGAAAAGVPRRGALQVTLNPDRADAIYAIGETVRLMLITSEDAYVTVLDIGPTGQVTQLFPSPFQPDNRVFADTPVEIGGSNSGARVTVTGPVGAELVKVIASSKPVTVVSESQLAGSGAFRTVKGGVRTVLRNLEVVADQAIRGNTRIGFVNVPLRTVAGSQPAGAVPGLAILGCNATVLNVTGRTMACASH